MRKRKDSHQRGFIIKYIILAVAALALLKYFFNWSIFDALASEEGRSTIDYTRRILGFVWSYLSLPATYAWNEIVWPLIEWAVANLKKS